MQDAPIGRRPRRYRCQILFCIRSCSLFYNANVAFEPAVSLLESYGPDHALGTAEAALIAFADAGLDSRVTLLGSHTLDLLCALLRQGHVSASAMRLSDRPPSGTADVVLVPYVGSPDHLARAIVQARRQLVPFGTLALHLSGSPDAGLLRQAGQLLTLHGFGLVRRRVVSDEVLVRAELPLHGRLACA
jgi:hypothetical protein